MITKEEFISLINDFREYDELVDSTSGKLNISNLHECNLITYAFGLFEKVLKLSFNEHGIEDIYWWLYEKAGSSSMKMWDENNNEIPTETLDDLWNIVKDNRK